MRRTVAVVAAVVLVLEAVALGLAGWVMGLAVRHQQMSLAGLAPNAMAVGAWVGGGLAALFLAGCAAVLVRVAWRDRAPGRIGRALLLACAVTHAVLGAGALAPIGWAAFGVLMVAMALVVWSLLLYAREPLLPPGDRPVRRRWTLRRTAVPGGRADLATSPSGD
jgi:hypothetical protein